MFSGGILDRTILSEIVDFSLFYFTKESTIMTCSNGSTYYLGSDGFCQRVAMNNMSAECYEYAYFDNVDVMCLQSWEPAWYV